MNPERHQQIGQLYHEALELEGSERAAFLEQSCGGDAELRREVESLIAAHEKVGSFMESPAFEDAAKLLASARTKSLIGKSLGQYQIVSLLGSGGMGEVYLARDTKLRRKVALKLLSDQFIQDGQRVRRFQQEALAVSGLNHPNIL